VRPDRKERIFTDPAAHDRVLRRVVPREFRDITILWNENLCKAWYPKVTDWQVYWHQFMAVQWFSKTHPEFDYVWNWEVDVRFTGHHYHFLEKLASFAEAQPRKYLWERNARFYIPANHGSHAQFMNDTNTIIDTAYKMNVRDGDKADPVSQALPIWGPDPFSPLQKPIGPIPPTTMDEDNFQWGVGEQADLISLLPIWDPRHTSWSYKDKIWNFIPGVHPVFNDEHPADKDFTHPDFIRVNRRVIINTCLRFSKRMLQAMHEENLDGRTMQAEMWPGTVALHHGLKAVYAPHPVWSNRKWPARYADAVFNADGEGDSYNDFGGTLESAGQGTAIRSSGKKWPARWGQEADSIYNQDRENNFMSWTWYFRSEFPRVLYRRWMGEKAVDRLGNIGGEAWEQEWEVKEGRFEPQAVVFSHADRVAVHTGKNQIIGYNRRDYDTTAKGLTPSLGGSERPRGGFSFTSKVFRTKMKRTSAQVPVQRIRGRMCLPAMLLHPVKRDDVQDL